jgi:hypothetical protein
MNKRRLNTTSLDNRLTDGAEVVSFKCQPLPASLPPGRFLALICYSLNQPLGYSVAENIRYIENSKDF